MKLALDIHRISVNDGKLGPVDDARYVKSRLGYDVEVLDAAGDFRRVIKVPDDTSEFYYLKSEFLNFLRPKLKQIIFGYLRYTLERFHSSTVKTKFKFIDLFACEISKGVHIHDFLDSISAMSGRKRGEYISTCKEFLRFAILNEYEDLSLEAYEEFNGLRGYAGKKNSYQSLFMMDKDKGPFSKEEISVLSAQVENESLPLGFRLILELCLCFGLRPMQLSLLRRKDFIKDPITGISYLNVPRIKKRTRDRRSQFSSRLLSERTANLIKLYIDSSWTPGDVNPAELPIFISSQAVGLEADKNSYGSHFWDEDEFQATFSQIPRKRPVFIINPLIALITCSGAVSTDFRCHPEREKSSIYVLTDFDTQSEHRRLCLVVRLRR